MSDELKIPVQIPLDDEGMIGRESQECKRYFKLKPGTGLLTDRCHCPYCEYEGNSNSFWTPAQIEYMQSIAMNHALTHVIRPSLEKLSRTFKEFERKTRNTLIQLKFKQSRNSFSIPVKYYTEKELETKIVCDNCGLVFSIYGVFASCPDCNQLNAFLIYTKSIEVTKKQLDIFSKPDLPKEIQQKSLAFILSSCILAFDGLGKELKKRKPTAYPDQPKNLFQNLFKLNIGLNNYIAKNHSNLPFLIKMFQVRHIYEHNMGVIDDNFVEKVSKYNDFIGRKYFLSTNELQNFIISMEELGILMKNYFDNV